MNDIAIVDTASSLTGIACFRFLDDYVCKSITVTQEARRILSITLALMKERWDEFPMEETGYWDYDFYTYARDRTGGYSRSAIDNHVNVGATWLLQLPDGLPATVELYDAAGRATGETIIPDPETQCVSKLLVATGAAKDGRLFQDPVALGQLFNPDVAVHILSATIQGHTKHLESPKNDQLQMWVEGGVIYAKVNGDIEWVAELNLENKESVRRGREYLLVACGIVK